MKKGPTAKVINSSQSNSPRPSSPSSSTSSTTNTVPQLTAFLNLPLRLTLIPSGPLPERSISGSLYTYDPTTSLAVLSAPSTLSTPNPHSTASQKRSYHFVHTSQISSVAVLSNIPDPGLPPPGSDPFESGKGTLNLSLKDAEARVERAVKEDVKARARVGKGVSEEAQALFDALGKTLPVRWHESSIIVLDEVVIASPYGPADVKGGKGANERVERVRKVLEGERQRRSERQGGS